MLCWEADVGVAQLACMGRPCPGQPASFGSLAYWVGHVSVEADQWWGQIDAGSEQVHEFRELESG